MGGAALLIAAAAARRELMAFPRPNGASYFPFYGDCGAVECGLLYADLFALAAVTGWLAYGWAEDVLSRSEM